MSNENEMVTSIWGRITRREMLRNLMISGFTLGLSGTSVNQVFANTDDIVAPPKEIGGTPFREIKTFQTVEDELFDITKLQKFGMPKPRRRDTSWFDKPSGAVGVSLMQFTNTPLSPYNTCAQAACATMLNYHKKAPKGFIGDGITNEIYRTHPPNYGARGTGFYFTEQILSDYGLKTWSGRSNELTEPVITEKLKTWISQGFPCIVLVDVKVPMNLSYGPTQGHFVTVFAYTDTHVFMTNWHYKKVGGWANDWKTFMKAWSLPDSQNHHLLLAGWV